jgi:hypothetical protein
MRLSAVFVTGCAALLLGCGGTDGGKPPGPTPGGSGGDTGGAGGSTGYGGSGGSGGSTPTGGSGGGSAGSGGSTGGSGGSAGSGGSTGGSGGSSAPDAGTYADAAKPTDGGPSAPPPGPVPPGLHPIFDGMTLNGWFQTPANGFAVKDGAMTSTGAGRGWIATNNDYTHYRVLFKLKPGGTGGHQPTVLIFNTRPPPMLDAMGGIQFQPPGGSHWDYRPGQNKSGAGFTKVGSAGPAVDGWHNCEMVVNATTSEAKMACGGKDVLHYKNPGAGKVGPWAIQTHNKGITDAYKDIQIEEGLTSDDYITVK